jgi:hypothetical protein
MMKVATQTECCELFLKVRHQRIDPLLVSIGGAADLVDDEIEQAVNVGRWPSMTFACEMSANDPKRTSHQEV